MTTPNLAALLATVWVREVASTTGKTMLDRGYEALRSLVARGERARPPMRLSEAPPRRLTLTRTVALDMSLAPVPTALPDAMARRDRTRYALWGEAGVRIRDTLERQAPDLDMRRVQGQSETVQPDGAGAARRSADRAACPGRSGGERAGTSTALRRVLGAGARDGGG